MKYFLFTLLVICNTLFCYSKQPVERKDLKSFFDQYKVDGAILILDNNNKEYMGYNLKKCNEGFSPASTFKIPNTLIALETGIITTETIFHWEGEKRRYPRWEADMNIQQAYNVSNVPVYQDIARRIGLERMKEYVRLFHYGDMDIREDNLDKFWLEGNSVVTLYQQIDFLVKLQERQLPVREEVIDAMKQIMIREENNNYTLRAKTGWTETDFGWYTGYYETNNNVYYFAILIQPTEHTDMENFGEYRLQITYDTFSYLNLL